MGSGHVRLGVHMQYSFTIVWARGIWHIACTSSPASSIHVCSFTFLCCTIPNFPIAHCRLVSFLYPSAYSTASITKYLVLGLVWVCMRLRLIVTNLLWPLSSPKPQLVQRRKWLGCLIILTLIVIGVIVLALGVGLGIGVSIGIRPGNATLYKDIKIDNLMAHLQVCMQWPTCMTTSWHVTGLPAYAPLMFCILSIDRKAPLSSIHHFDGIICHWWKLFVTYSYFSGHFFPELLMAVLHVRIACEWGIFG